MVRNLRTQGGVSDFIADIIPSSQLRISTLVNDNIEINTTKVTIESNSYIVCSIDHTANMKLYKHLQTTFLQYSKKVILRNVM